MRSKNQSSLTAAQSAHLRRVKELPCSVCRRAGGSDAHHIKQGQHYTAVALCWECHHPPIGWHGTKVLWRVKKMNELDALAITIERMMESRT